MDFREDDTPRTEHVEKLMHLSDEEFEKLYQEELRKARTEKNIE